LTSTPFVLSVGPNEYGQLGQAFRSTNPQLTLPAAEDIAASLAPTTPLVVALVAGTAEQTSSFSGLGSSAIPTSTAPPSTAPPSTAPASSTAPPSTAPSPAAGTSLGYAILATVREGGTSQSEAASGEVTQLDTIRSAVLAAIAAAAGWGVHRATRRGSRSHCRIGHRGSTSLLTGAAAPRCARGRGRPSTSP